MKISRKNFFIGAAAAAVAFDVDAASKPKQKKIQGFNETDEFKIAGPWKPFSDKKVRVGIAVSGVYAHMSAMKGGEMLKIPVFS